MLALEQIPLNLASIKKAPNRSSPKLSKWKDKIHCMDCREGLDNLPESSIDLVVTDPPYFLDRMDSNWNDKSLARSKKRAGVVGGLPIGMKFDPAQANRLHEFYREVSKKILRVLKPGGFFLSFSQPRLSYALAQGVHEADFEIRDIYTWHYRNKAQFKAFSQDHFVDRMNMPDSKKQRIKQSMQGRKTPQLRPQSELIIMAQKPRDGTFVENWQKWQTGLIDAEQRLNGFVPSTVMAVDKPSREKYNSHLTVKPVPLLNHLIQVFSLEGQCVLDPFIGSGTTAISSIMTKRNWIGFEIEPSYVEIANRRIASL